MHIHWVLSRNVFKSHCMPRALNMKLKEWQIYPSHYLKQHSCNNALINVVLMCICVSVYPNKVQYLLHLETYTMDWGHNLSHAIKHASRHFCKPIKVHTCENNHQSTQKSPDNIWKRYIYTHCRFKVIKVVDLKREREELWELNKQHSWHAWDADQAMSL